MNTLFYEIQLLLVAAKLLNPMNKCS